MIAKLSRQNNPAKVKDAAPGAAVSSRYYDQLHPNRARQMNPNQGRTSVPAHRTGRGR